MLQGRGPGRGRTRQLGHTADVDGTATRLGPRRRDVEADLPDHDVRLGPSSSEAERQDLAAESERWYLDPVDFNPMVDPATDDDDTPDTSRPRTSARLISLAAAWTALAAIPVAAAVPPPPMPSAASSRGLLQPTGRADVRDRRRSASPGVAPKPQHLAPLQEGSPRPTTAPPSPRFVEQQEENLNDTLIFVPTASYSAAFSVIRSGTATTGGPYAHITCPPISLVDETALPYYITQGEDGHWTKADAGWVLFGRGTAPIPVATAAVAEAPSSASSGSATTSQATALAASNGATATYDVTSALPKGWGKTSDRSSLYAVPLIVVSSVILAALITAFIVFIVISRVKHRQKIRRRKRRQEEERRAKMRLAGLEPEDDGDVEGDRAASPRGSMDSRRSRGSQAARPQSLAAAIVTGRRQLRGSGLGGNRIQEWRKGLRKRKVGGGTAMPEVTAEEAAGQATLSPARDGGEMSPSSTQPDQGEPEQSGSVTSPDLPGTDTLTEETSNSSNPGASAAGAVGRLQIPTALNLTRGEIEQVEREAEVHASAPPPIHGGATTFLPAYRPASIHAAPTAGQEPPPISSASRHLEQDVSEALAPYTPRATDAAEAGPSEKSGRPGYYPAPTTIEQEEAVAVASGSGQVQDTEETVTSGHVATDDKRVLQQLMQNSSSAPLVEHLDQSVSTAPVLDVDEDGFERIPGDEGTQSNADAGSATRRMAPGLPAPPRPVYQCSAPHISMIPAMEAFHTPAETPLDLLASEPQWTRIHADASAPSAPDFDDEEEDDAERPSAPPLDDGDRKREGIV